MSDLHDALGETAMLAVLRTSAFGTRRNDRQAGEEVSQDNDAVSGAARVSVNVLAGADELHKEIMGLQREARADFNAMTTVWDEEGWRLLPNANFMRLTALLRPHSDRMGELKARLRGEAPIILAKAQDNLGKFAGRVRLPTEAEMVDAYSIRLEFAPVPSAGNLPTTLPPATLDFLKKRVREQTERKVGEAMLEPLARVATMLEHFVSRMAAANERDDKGEGGRHGTFRNTIVTGLQDLVGVLSSFNLSGDAMYADICGRLEGMVGDLSPDTLRVSRQARDDAARQARDVLDVLALYRGSK